MEAEAQGRRARWSAESLAGLAGLIGTHHGRTLGYFADGSSCIKPNWFPSVSAQ